MKLSRLVPVLVLSAAPFGVAQLPPGLIQPGRTVVPVPAAPAAPVTPAAPAPAGENGAPATETTGQGLAPVGGLNSLTAEEMAQGWILLFDGQKVYRMRGVQKADPLSAGWKIRDGELALPKDIKDMDRMTGGDLITSDVFWDFDFRFEWKATVSANSGVRYMMSEAMGKTPPGLEYQIIDDTHNSMGLKGGPLRRSGAADNVLPAGPNAKLRSADPLNKQGDPWNEGRILVQGTHVEHWLNGDKVLEFELSPQLRRLAEANKMPGLPVTFGQKGRTRIAILDEGTEVAFRNLKIRPLPPQAVVIPRR